MEKQNPEVLKHMGQVLKSIRVSQNIDQEDMAFTLGLSRASMNNIEAGRQSISHTALLKACGVLSITPDQIFPPVEPEILLHASREVREKARIERLEKKLKELKQNFSDKQR